MFKKKEEVKPVKKAKKKVAKKPEKPAEKPVEKRKREGGLCEDKLECKRLD
jgi:hypothetical protein